MILSPLDAKMMLLSLAMVTCSLSLLSAEAAAFITRTPRAAQASGLATARPAVLAVSPRLSASSIGTTSLQMGLFGTDSDRETKELARLPGLSNFDGLSVYIDQWSEKLFGDGGKKSGLTTAVDLVKVEGSDDGSVEKCSGVKIMFRPKGGKNVYKDKDDEQEEGGSSKKDKPKKEGGVEVLVEELTGGNVQVVARRCDVDEDTMIKEMSEETIVSKLKEAVKAWKKDN